MRKAIAIVAGLAVLGVANWTIHQRERLLAEGAVVLLELAPFLLLGMVVAGVLHVALPDRFVHRQLRGRFGVVKAVLLGVPLPLCSCGVIPTALGLRRDGASRGATVGFLISTPQTGVDSILVSASFLGWPFAIFKVGAAALTGVVGGFLADATRGGRDPDAAPEPAPAESTRRGLRSVVAHALEILRSIWHWVVVGILASALITSSRTRSACRPVLRSRVNRSTSSPSSAA